MLLGLGHVNALHSRTAITPREEATVSGMWLISNTKGDCMKFVLAVCERQYEA